MKQPITALVISSLFITLPACESTGPKYRNVKAYSEGFAPVQASNGRWGYINERQQWTIQPRFEDAQEFRVAAPLFVRTANGASSTRTETGYEIHA